MFFFNRKKKKHHRSSKQKLIDADDFSFTDDDDITSTDEVYIQEQTSNDVIVHCNPGFTSDSDSKESSNKRREEDGVKKSNNTKNQKYLESSTSHNGSTSDISSPALSLRNQEVQLVQSKSPVKEDTFIRDDILWSSKLSAEKVTSNAIVEDKPNHPTPPPRAKKVFRGLSLTQKLSKLSSHFSHSTLSSHISSEDSVQTAVHLSPTETQEEYQDLPHDK